MSDDNNMSRFNCCFSRPAELQFPFDIFADNYSAHAVGVHEFIVLNVDHHNAKGKATARNIRKTLQKTRELPTFIYLAGHTETHNGENVYMPVDCIKRNRLATEKLIPYAEMHTLLTSQPDAAPLVLMTEVCYSDNFLRLPYTLEYKGGDVIWVGTEDRRNNHNSLIIHFTAMSLPKTWSESSCGMFTQSFFDVPLDEKLSICEMVHRFKAGHVNGEDGQTNLHQHFKVYSSHKLDDPHFFEALGFYSGTKGSPCNTEYHCHGDRLREAHSDHLGLVGAVHS